MEGLTEERVHEIANAFLTARELLPEQSQFVNVAIPVNVPAMARRIAGDVLGWPLHLRHRTPEDTQEMGIAGTPMVMPIMRHKPAGVSLLENRRRVQRSRTGAEEAPATGQEPHALFGDYDPSFGGQSNDLVEDASGFGVGTTVQKFFDGELYNGTVAKIDDFPTGRYYLIIYDDGNQEHVTAEELAKVAV